MLGPVQRKTGQEAQLPAEAGEGVAWPPTS
jgi:hypothetical protein